MIIRRNTNPRMSQSVEFPAGGSIVALSGQVSDQPDADISVQTADILNKIDRLLADAGTDKSHLTNVYVWLASIGDFDRMNEAYDRWVAPGAAPARACVEARLADPRLKVEIQVFAVKEVAG